MSGIPTAKANSLLDSVLGSGTPATVYVCLVTTLAGPADTGSTIVQPTSGAYTGYARVAVANDATHWPAASAGSKANGLAVAFPACTAGTGVTVVGWAICDAATLGNLIAYGPLAAGLPVAAGVQPQFDPAGLTVTLS